MLKILIADDHPLVRIGLKQILLETYDQLVVDEAGDSQQVMNKALNNDYHLILLDLNMPDVSGLEMVKQLKAEKPNLPILILSIHPEELYAIPALRAGASGYLTKDKIHR